MKNKNINHALCFSILMCATFFNIETVVGQTPLSRFIKSNKYDPFVVPRSDWGVGTSIIMQNGRETINALNENCLNLSPQISDAYLESESYTLSIDNKLELGLAKVFGDQLDLKLAFQDKRVKKVVITLKGAEESIIPTIRIKQKIDSFANAKNNICLSAMVGRKNIVITRTLSVASLSYTFFDSSDHNIDIDASILKTIKVSDSLKVKYEGKKELSIDKRAFIGYRATKFKAKAGLTNTEIQEELLEPEAIEELKRNSKVPVAPHSK